MEKHSMKESTHPKSNISKEVESGKYREYYLVYNRKSTDEPENQKNSIIYQKSENARFAFREHLPIAHIDIEGFCADGIISEKHSAFKEDSDLILGDNGLVQYRIDRPKFAKLVQLLHKGYFKGVIVLCWDRISRNKGDESVIRKLIKSGIDFRFALATYDKSSSGALHMDIDGMFAEHHSRVTSEKVSLNIRNQRDKGICTYKAPVGYLNTGTMENKPFDPERAPIIKQMFELYTKEGWALSDLTQWAIEQGFTMPPTRPKRTKAEMLQEEVEDTQNNIPKISHLPNNCAIHRILTNPFYTGKTMGNNGEFVKSNSHKALVSEEVFNKVQRLLNKSNVSIHYTDKITYPLRGWVRCNDCKRVYTPYTQKGIIYYGAHCKNGCTNGHKSFNVEQMVDFIGDKMLGLCFTESELAEINTNAGSNEIALLEEQRLKQSEVQERKKKKINEDISYLQMNKLNLLKTGVYSPEALIQEESNLKNELMRLQNEEVISNVSMAETINNIVKLSELSKNLHLYYENANHDEKDTIIRFVFSELNLFQSTLIYKCQNGFQALKSRFVSSCGLSDWLSELPYHTDDIKLSIRDLEEYLNNHSTPDVAT